MPNTFKFPKKERLHGVTTVKRLFSEGKGFVAYPFKCVYITSSLEVEICPNSDHPSLNEGGDNSNNGVRALFSVGKKYSKRAVKRNKTRRRAKEAYRLNKLDLKEGINVDIAFIYISKKEEEYKSIEYGVKKAISIINKIYQEDIDLPTGGANSIL